MARATHRADLAGVKIRTLLGVVAGALSLAVLVAESGTATAGARSCADVAANGGYSYAGHQSSHRGHGVRATITVTSELQVSGAGHVSGWVGVGGPGQGPGGEDAWIQVGIGSVYGTAPFVYAEVTRPGRYPRFILLEEDLQVGDTRNVAVREIAGRRGWWQVWVDGRPATKRFKLRGSSGRWAPIATAESFSGGEAACNSFAFRFERVLVSHDSPGGAWRPFDSAYRFLDGGNRLHALATGSARPRRSVQLLASESRPLPYAFVASS